MCPLPFPCPNLKYSNKIFNPRRGVYNAIKMDLGLGLVHNQISKPSSSLLSPPPPLSIPLSTPSYGSGSVKPVL